MRELWTAHLISEYCCPCRNKKPWDFLILPHWNKREPFESGNQMRIWGLLPYNDKIAILNRKYVFYNLPAMFCQKCGKENPGTNQFCGEWGEPLKKIVQDNTQKKIEHKPRIVLILMGLFIILAMYLVPFNQSYLGSSLTSAKTVEICSSPFPVHQMSWCLSLDVLCRVDIRCFFL